MKGEFEHVQEILDIVAVERHTVDKVKLVTNL
jgi:hypothetical protein